MGSRSISGCLLEMLEDLSASEFEKFCYCLMDRRTEPRVRRNKVEKKTRVEITDVLISTFTLNGAVGVAVELLRQMDCHQVADDLVRNTNGLL